MNDTTADIVIPESNRWADFAWPAWIPQHERDLIADFWSEKWNRGPRAWVADAIHPYTNETPTGAIVRMWGSVGGVRVPLVGRYIHRWNNIGTLLLDDGSTVHVSSVATDESIAAAHRRRVALVEEAERELAQLRARLAALEAAARAAGCDGVGAAREDERG